MATFYGSDSYCLDDLQRISTEVTDVRTLIGQRVARRLQTPRGALAIINGDPDFGWDVRQLCLAKLTPQSRAVAESQIQKECTKDEQVLSASVKVEPSRGDLVITISLVAADGPFLLVMNVGQLTTTALLTFPGQG